MLALTSILTDWINVMDWLTASEALALLGTRPQTLYANVSRGRIKARPDPLDSRRSLYRGDDVRRLAQRTAGRRKQETVAVQAMHDAAKRVNPEILVLCHGGPIAEPADAQYILDHTEGIVGFYGASSMERLPVEPAIRDRVREFTALKFRK